MLLLGKKMLFLLISSICIGIILGFLLVKLITYLPLSINNPALSALGIEKPHVIGFLPYWLIARADKNYNPYVTTLTYFGLTIDTDGHLLELTSPKEEEPGWHSLRSSQVQKMFQEAKSNHTQLSLTVVQQDEASISALLKNPTIHAKNLLSDIIPQMKKYGFTDLNIDIESFKKTDNKQRQQFALFLSEIKKGITKEHIGTITVDIAPNAFIKPFLIDPIKIGSIADYMLFMGYDFHGVLSANPGPIAPLNGAGVNAEYDITTAINIAIKEISPQKLILGIPLYGYQWDTTTNDQNTATIPNTGAVASNRRIMEMLPSCLTCISKNDSLATEHDVIYQDKKTDPYFHQAFLLDDNDFIKRIDFTKQYNFAGVALWALGYEGSSILNPLKQYKGLVNYTSLF